AYLKRAYAAAEKSLDELWKTRADGLPYRSPYDALIMASIVERETAVPDERAMIAGVFVRRLASGMRLQTDPTVIYGLGSAFDGNLRKVDLLADSPYNTYTRAGLPPTPICLPGRAAIHAALHPANGGALYFVARGDGTHQFSATLAEHEAAVRRYQLGHKP
ncbi:MAG TPA: endolytic transglycosylase MltG, partial [Nevskiaceae bacterium]|nr:endolytic transglycosylase MltG [Nevskiaceae bacterium]